MAQPAQARCINQVSSAAVGAAASGAFGYMGARLFTTIDPIHGAVFGIVSRLVSDVVHSILNKILLPPGANNEAQIVVWALNVSIGVAVSLIICGYLGFQFTVETAITLAISELVTRLLAVFCCPVACAVR